MFIEVRILNNSYFVRQKIRAKVLDTLAHDVSAVVSQEVLVVCQFSHLQSKCNPIVFKFLCQVALSVTAIRRDEVKHILLSSLEMWQQSLAELAQRHIGDSLVESAIAKIAFLGEASDDRNLRDSLRTHTVAQCAVEQFDEQEVNSSHNECQQVCTQQYHQAISWQCVEWEHWRVEHAQCSRSHLKIALAQASCIQCFQHFHIVALHETDVAVFSVECCSDRREIEELSVDALSHDVLCSHLCLGFLQEKHLFHPIFEQGVSSYSILS